MAGDGLIENNRFERLTKSAISIGHELGFWREAGWVKNLRITGNTLRDIGVDASLSAIGSYVPGAIGIFVRTENGKPPYPPGNENILIENNTIDGCSVAGIHVYAASGLVIRNNTLRNTNRVRAAGWTDPVNHLVTSGPISTEGVTGATLENNTVAP
jgi:parallel beta-helix repeat protein